MEIFSPHPLRFVAFPLIRTDPQLQGCIINSCVSFSAVAFREECSGSKCWKSLEVEDRLTFLCVSELALLQCAVRAVIEWISQ